MMADFVVCFSFYYTRTFINLKSPKLMILLNSVLLLYFSWFLFFDSVIALLCGLCQISSKIC